MSEPGLTSAPPPELTASAQRRARRARQTPQPHDGWTFVVVPPGAHSRARTLRFSVRRLRAFAVALIASAAVTAASGIVLVLLVATLPPLTSQDAGVEMGLLAAAPDSAAAIDEAAAPEELSPLATVPEPARARSAEQRRSRPPSQGSAPATAPSSADLADISGLPVLGRISSRFSSSRRHPMLGVVRRHNGIDIAAPAGTPITAPHTGVVTFTGRRVGYGNVIEVDHGDGVVTLYAHLRAIMVAEGDRVADGQQIGTVGATGLATGPHLHFEIIVNGRNVNPLTTPLASLFPADSAPVPLTLTIPGGERTAAPDSTAGVDEDEDA